MNKYDKKIYKMVITALLAALCFAATAIHIPLPNGGFIHLGNFVAIIGALLCGGLIGGIAGSLGMGLYDLLIYYGGFEAGTMRTFVLKFFMAFIAGAVFRLILKKKLNSNIFNGILLGVFTIGFGLSIAGVIKGTIPIGNKTMTIHWIVPVFLGCLVVLYLLSIIFGRKLSRLGKAALASCSLGIAFNIFGEIFIKALLYYIWTNSKYTTFNAAFIYSLSGLPSVVITSTITCILCAIVFEPVYKGVSKVNKYDDISQFLD